MSINYPNLPGIEVMLKDGGLILPEDASTESILIIGPAPSGKTVGADVANGQVPENPVLIRVKEDLVANNFSSANTEFVHDGGVNELSAAWKRAYEGGSRRIYLLAIDAEAEAAAFEATPGSPTADELYKGFFIGAHKNLFGILEDFTVDHLVVIDGFADKKTLSVTETELGVSDLSATLGLDSETVQEDDGTGTMVDVTYYYGNFAKTVAEYAEKQTTNHNTVIGYVGTTAPTNNGLAAVKTHVDTLVANAKQYSGHLSIIAGPELGYRLPGISGLIYRNGAVTYAALISTLRAESAPTNKPVYGVSGMSYNMSLRQLNSLSGAQFTSFRLKNNQVHVTDGITTAPDQIVGNVTYKSDYIRLSTLRITHAAVRLVREVADPFVGEPNGAPQRNSLKSTIRGGLEGMKQAGAIADFRFTLTSTPRQRILGQSHISLELVPALEMRKISVDVSLRADLESKEA